MGLREILDRTGLLEGSDKGRVLVQLIELAGLRQLGGQLTIEMKSMGIAKIR